MPSLIHDTTCPNALQAESLEQDEWESSIVPQLPAGWQEQAEIWHAFERVREVRSPADLLRGLLAYTLCVTSFRHLSCWSLLVGLADVSDTAWRKRLRQAGEWLVWLLSELLSVSACQSPWLVRGGWRRVLLLDGTHLTCPGPKGQVWRIHSAFDLLAGRLSQIQITDRHTAETLTLFDVQAGDLLVSDSANGYRDRLFAALSQQADLLVRFCPQSLPMEDEQGRCLDLLRWLKGRHAPAGRVCERRVVIQHQGQRATLRCVALRLSAEQRQRSQRRKKRKARDDGRKIQADTLYLAGWLLLVTTLPAKSWSAQQVLQLYQARWHIELLFKRIKQLLRQHRLRCSTAPTARATLASLLLGWVLQEQELVQARQILREAGEELSEMAATSGSLAPESFADPATSEWLLAVLCLDQLRHCVHGIISRERLHACWPRLQRFVRVGPRRRRHFYTDCCLWLTGRTASPAGGLP